MSRVAIDIETSGGSTAPDPFRDKILLTSVVFDDSKEESIQGENYPDWLFELIQDPNYLKLIHNSPFEGKFWLEKFGVAIQNVWDTLAIERVLTAGKEIGGNDLQAVALRRLGKYLDKSIRETIGLGVIGDREIEYNLDDSRVLLPIHEQQMREIERKGQQTAAEIENDIMLVVADMEHHGIGFDQDLWEEFVPLMIERRDAAQQVVWDALGITYQQDLFGRASGGLSLNCRDAVLDCLSNVGIDLKDYTKSTLRDYQLRHPEDEIISAIIKFKKWDKAYGWNYPQYTNSFTNRIHTDWNPQRADTFRFSASKPNLQQVTKPFELNFRHLFISRSGYKFIGADFSQIELRILADITRESAYVEEFLKDGDPHHIAASTVLGRNAKKDERNLGKAVNFGVVAYKGSYLALIGSALDYGMLIPTKDARKYVKKLRRENTKIEAWGASQLQKMQMNGYLSSPIGHRRYLPGEDRETVARNTSIQMHAAGILKDGMRNVFRRIVQELDDAHIVLQVHDELVLEVKEEEVSLGEQILIEEMTAAGNRWMNVIPCEVDSYISDTWEK